MPMDRWITKCEKELWNCILEKEIPSFLKQARIHTGFHRSTENGQICHNKYLTGFVKTWLEKFQVHFNYLTSKWNGKQLKVTS